MFERFFSPDIRPLRLLIASIIIVTTPIASLSVDNMIERIALIIAAGLIALVIGLDQKTPAARSSEARAPILESERATIVESPDLRVLIDALPDPLLILDGMNIIIANKSAHGLLGVDLEGEDIRLAIRHPVATDMLMKDPFRPPARPLKLPEIGNTGQRWELYVRLLSGGEKVLYLWDRSRNYALDKIRTDFVANASHELRTPLASIIGFIETLEDAETGNDPETRSRFLNVMSGEAHRMQRLIEDLISLSRIEATKFNQPDTIIDLPELIREVADFYDGRNGRNILTEITPDVGEICADRPQLSQLLHNLVSNALKYGLDATPVTIGVRPSKTGVMAQLWVRDEGDGIDPKHLPRLTERFYRVDSGRSRAVGGTGLGLAIVKHIVERHSGRLDIDSVLGKGTTFTVSLPVKNAKIQAKIDTSLAERTLAEGQFPAPTSPPLEKGPAEKAADHKS